MNDLRKRVKAAGSMEAVASKMGFTRQYILRLLNGQDKMSAAVAAKLGYEKLPERYRKIKSIDAPND